VRLSHNFRQNVLPGPGKASKSYRELPHGLTPCNVSVQGNGGYSFETALGGPNFRTYARGDWRENEARLREALTALYESFRRPEQG
jgi:hypothetical protein